MFWKKRFDSIETRLVELTRTLEIERQSRALALTAPRPEPPPFVCVLAMGQWKGSSAFAGRSAILRERRMTLDLHAQVHLTHVRVIVFCDLQRVAVQSMFLGVDVLHFILGGECPIVQFEEWRIGVPLRIQCETRGAGADQ